MILNTTKKPFLQFSAMQRLAVGKEMIVNEPMDSIEQFERAYKKYVHIRAIIVDPEDIVFANDVLNYVSCPVVTLNTEILSDTGRVNFLPYYDEDNH